MAQYAKATEVSIRQSRDEIESLLERYGATAFVYATEGLETIIGFRIAERHVRMRLPMRPQADFERNKVGAHRPNPTATWEQDCKARWRALVLIIKAKLVAVDQDITTIEREFLTDIIMPNNRTVGEMLQPQLEAAYTSGKMPPLLTGPTS